MTGTYDHLVAHIRDYSREVFCAALTTRQWPAVRLYLELARADYAALPVRGAGWVGLTPHRLPFRALAHRTDRTSLAPTRQFTPPARLSGRRK
jgi:hypothetical protein